MAPILHCVRHARHAQGFHNLGAEFHSLPDPKLTPLGEEQCATLRLKSFADQSNVSLVMASPLSRTLHTAFLVFAPALRSGNCADKIIAVPDAQETSDYPCDTGSDLDVLQGICKEHGWPVDLSLVHTDWNVKTLSNRYSPASDAIKTRARDARRTIRERIRQLIDAGNTHPEVILVAHGGYLHYFTEDWEDSNKLNGTGWENCETRAYVFESGVEGDDDAEAHLVETSESRHKRGIDHARFSKLEQETLFLKSMQGWEDQGLQNPSKLGLSHDRKEIDPRGQEPAAKNMNVDEQSGVVEVIT